jgi:transcriptional regulator with XRE-family HTH domain
MKMKTASDWLNDKYLEWQYKEHKSMSYKEFAEYLGIGMSASMVKAIIGGSRNPSEGNAYKLAEKFDDEIILDILGYPRLNPQFKRLKKVFNEIPPELQKDVVDKFVNMLRDSGWLQED